MKANTSRVNMKTANTVTSPRPNTAQRTPSPNAPASRTPAPRTSTSRRRRHSYRWLQSALVVGSVVASLVGAHGLQRQALQAAAATPDAAPVTVAAALSPASAPPTVNTLPSIGDLPALDLAPIPTVPTVRQPAVQPPVVTRRVAPVARSRSSR